MTGQYTGEGVSPDEVLDVTSLGEGLKKVREEKIELTHERAEQILSMTELPGDRLLRNKHVDRLTDAMMRGTFVWDFVSIITCRCAETGKTYRMNGQHTCWARLNMQEKYRAPCRLIHYQAETEADMRRLYASIDRNSPRTKPNVIDSYLVGTPEFGHTKKRSLRLAASGLALWLWEKKSERSSHDGDDISYLMLSTYYDLAAKVVSIFDELRPVDHSHVYRQSVAAAMYATCNVAPQVARRFWISVADGSGFESANDPGLRLRNYLMKTTVESGQGVLTGKKRSTIEELYRICLVAWNAHRRGDKVKMLRSPGGRPKVL